MLTFNQQIGYTQEHQLQPHCRSNGGGSGRGGGGRGTLWPAADAFWRPEMNYRRFRVRQLRVAVHVVVIIYFAYVLET